MTNIHTNKGVFNTTTALILALGLFFLAIPSLFTAAASSPPTILPQRYLREYDPITILFPEAVGPAKGGPEDHPGRFVTISPPQPGAFQWIDGRTLIFKPVVPWPPLAKIRLRVLKRSRTLNTLMTPPRSISPPDGTSNLAPVEQVVLSFAEPISKADLARMVSFEVRPLPGVGDETAIRLDSTAYSIKAQERKSLSDPAFYVFRLKTPIGLGKRVIIHIKLSLDRSLSGSVADSTFSTKEPFRITAAGCLAGSANPDHGGTYSNRRILPHMLPLTLSGTSYSREQALNGGSEAPRVVLTFSSKPAPLTPSIAKDLIHFIPSVRGFSFSQEGRNLYVTGSFQRGKVYQAILRPAPFSDRSGRPLRMDGPSSFFFYFPARRAFLSLDSSRCIMERFGPQMLPLSGRSEEKLDLRVYKVEPLDRNFWPFPNKPVVVNEAVRPPGPGEEPPSMNNINRNPTSGEIAARIKMLGSPPYSRIVTLPTASKAVKASFGLPLREAFAKVGGSNNPGVYLVGIRRLTGGPLRRYVRIQVTDLSLTVVEEAPRLTFLVTSLKTALPVPGAAIELQGYPWNHENKILTLYSGVTDEQGFLRCTWRNPNHTDIMRIVIRKGNDFLVLSPDHAPPYFKDGHWWSRDSRNGWLPWNFQDSDVHENEKRNPMYHLLSERPVYKPGDVVHIKGYVRLRVAGKLAKPPLSGYALLISGPGDKTWKHSVTLNDNASFSYDFKGNNLPTGAYNAVLLLKDASPEGRELSWKMEAYRIPRFHVDLHGPDRVSMDKPFSISLTASYYAGGQATDRTVLWKVTQFPYAYVPPKRKGYFFSSDQRFSRSTRFRTPPAIEKNAKTDDEGASYITMNPQLEIEGKARMYAFEATVTGPTGQTVTAQRRVVALPAFVLGLKVKRFVRGVGALHPDIIAIDPHNALLTNKEVEVRLLARRWHSHLAESNFSSAHARYVTDVSDTQVYKTTIRTAKAPVTVALPVAKAGVYVVEVSSRDRLGRLQLVSVDLYVAGSGAVAWKKPREQVFETSTDKDSYNPGDNARIILKSPFQHARILAVVEAPAGNVYKTLEVNGGKAVFTLPIKNEYNPRIPVHFVLMRGRLPLRGDAAMEGALDLGKPQTLAATRWIKVNPVDNELKVTLEHKTKALPGETVPFTIKLATPDGRPMAGEVTLWLVDQAVLALGKEKRLDPLPSFIRDVKSRAVIDDTRNLAVGHLAYVEKEGGGGEEAERTILGKVTVRKVFKTVPYFNPHIIVDSSGKTVVRIKLSDDLTVFMVRAVACSGMERFGYAKSRLAVRLPLIVQPALPRFARVGDRFEAGGIGRVVEGGGGTGGAEIKVNGVKLGAATSRKVYWKKGKPEQLLFPMTVLPPLPSASEGGRIPKLTVTLGVKRDSDGAADAFKVSIPVLPDRRPVRSETFARLAPGHSLSLPTPKEALRPGSLKRTVLVTRRGALLKLASGLDYLFTYRQECTEQRVSMAFPIVALKPLTNALHLPLDAGRGDEIIRQTFEYITTTLKPDGLYSFWPGDNGRVWLTAYVVEFLVQARKAGYNFDPKLLDRPVAALKQALRSDYSNLVSGFGFYERCRALKALSDAGYLDPSYASELARKAPYLTLYSESRVLEALEKGNFGNSSVIDELRKNLWNQTVFKLHNGKKVYGGLQYRNHNWGGLILSSETSTQAAMISALYAGNAKKTGMRLMVKDLVELGKGDGWGNTNATSSALLALGKVLESTPADSGTRKISLSEGGKNVTLVLDATHPTAYNVSTSDSPGKLTLGGKTGDGPLFARLGLSFLPKAPGSMAPARNGGFVVRREISRVSTRQGVPPSREWIDEPGKSLSFLKGDIVEIHVQVVNPEERHYVAVIAPIAAGMEPMNPNLAISSREAKPSGRLTLEPSYSMYLDNEVRFYYETLPKGTYDFYFRVKASTLGTFTSPGAHAEMLYHPVVEGDSPGMRVVVAAKPQA